MDVGCNMMVRWSYRCPWKAIVQDFLFFFPPEFTCLVVGMGEHLFLERFMVG